MKLKVSDLKLLMEYLEKEAVQVVDLINDKVDFGIHFEFSDLESRTCSVKLYEASTNTTPELTKRMKLYSRFTKVKPPVT